MDVGMHLKIIPYLYGMNRSHRSHICRKPCIITFTSVTILDWVEE